MTVGDAASGAARAMARDLKTPSARLADRLARLDRALDARDVTAGELAREASAIAAIAEDVAAAGRAIRRRVAIDRSRQPGNSAR